MWDSDTRTDLLTIVLLSLEALFSSTKEKALGDGREERTESSRQASGEVSPSPLSGPHEVGSS